MNIKYNMLTYILIYALSLKISLNCYKNQKTKVKLYFGRFCYPIA